MSRLSEWLSESGLSAFEAKIKTMPPPHFYPFFMITFYDYCLL